MVIFVFGRFSAASIRGIDVGVAGPHIFTEDTGALAKKIKKEQINKTNRK